MGTNYKRGDTARGDAYGVGGFIAAVVIGGIAWAIGGPAAGTAVYVATFGRTSAMAAEPQWPYSYIIKSYFVKWRVKVLIFK